MNEILREEIIQKLKEAPHKAGVNVNDWDIVKPDLVLVGDWYINYCEHHNLPHKFTRIIDKPIPGVSVSDSHNKRAFDGSLIGWTDADARECVFQANKQLPGIGAVSARDKIRRVAVFEPREFNDKGEMIKERHLHFQVAI